MRNPLVALRFLAAAGVVAFAMATSVGVVKADVTLGEQREAAFKRSLKHPENADLANAYAQLCIQMKDYEGAIGALERILAYRPDDAELKAQVGLLYYQLRSNQMAKHYIDAAAKGTLDPGLRSKLDALAPGSNEAGGSKAFGYLQTGVRYQTNAGFNSDNNILRLSNQDFVFSHPGSSGADWNGFQLLQAGYDYSLGNQRGDMIEARVSGYATEQFRFSDLNVGLYDLSLGPRLAIAPELLPGWTVKPYVVGGQFFLAGARYFASAGGGVVADMPVKPGYLVEPGIEVRRLDFTNASIFSSLNSGTSVTASIAAQAPVNRVLSLHGRAYYSRETAAFAFQSFDAVGVEIALSAAFRAPIATIATPWSVSPYLKFIQTGFGGPNPFIDDATTRRDREYQAGIVFDTPLTKTFSLVTNIEYAKVSSNIPNYKLHNTSVLTGPTVRF